MLRPSVDAAYKILNLSETDLPQKIDRLGASASEFAMHDHLFGAVEFVDALGQFAQRYQSRTLQFAYLIFDGFTHIENEQVVSAINSLFQLLHRNFKLFHSSLLRLCFGRRLRNPAEFMIVDERLNSRVFAADRTVRIFAQLHLAELHLQRVKEKKPPDE